MYECVLIQRLGVVSAHVSVLVQLCACCVPGPRPLCLCVCVPFCTSVCGWVLCLHVWVPLYVCLSVHRRGLPLPLPSVVVYEVTHVCGGGCSSVGAPRRPRHLSVCLPAGVPVCQGSFRHDYEPGTSRVGQVRHGVSWDPTVGRDKGSWSTHPRYSYVHRRSERTVCTYEVVRTRGGHPPPRCRGKTSRPPPVPCWGRRCSVSDTRDRPCPLPRTRSSPPPSPTPRSHADPARALGHGQFVLGSSFDRRISGKRRGAKPRRGGPFPFDYSINNRVDRRRRGVDYSRVCVLPARLPDCLPVSRTGGSGPGGAAGRSDSSILLGAGFSRHLRSSRPDPVPLPQAEKLPRVLTAPRGSKSDVEFPLSLKPTHGPPVPRGEGGGGGGQGKDPTG